MRSRWLIESVDFLRRHSVSSIDVVSKDASRSNCTWFLQWGTNHNYTKHFSKWNSFFCGNEFWSISKSLILGSLRTLNITLHRPRTCALRLKRKNMQSNASDTFLLWVFLLRPLFGNTVHLQVEKIETIIEDVFIIFLTLCKLSWKLLFWFLPCT